MPISLTTVRAEIKVVDRMIDANRRELRSREEIDALSWRSWGRAWDRYPALQTRDRALFFRRGELQRKRDRLEVVRARPARIKRPKKCPTCRGSGLAAKQA